MQAVALGVAFRSLKTLLTKVKFLLKFIKKKKLLYTPKRNADYYRGKRPYRSRGKAAIPYRHPGRNVRRHTLAEHRHNQTQCGAPHKCPWMAIPRKRHRATSRATPAVGGASTPARCAILTDRRLPMPRPGHPFQPHPSLGATPPRRRRHPVAQRTPCENFVPVCEASMALSLRRSLF